MNQNAETKLTVAADRCHCGCSHDSQGESEGTPPFSRRGFLQGVGCTAVGAALGAGVVSAAEPEEPLAPPPPKTLRVKPILTYQIQPRKEMDSYRDYGELDSMEKVNQESLRIAAELKRLAARAEFPIEVLPVEAVDTDEKAAKAAAADCDVLLIFPAGGWTINKIDESKTPKVVFIRHKSGPYYLGHEVVHWRVLRRAGDNFAPMDIDVGDVVVDRYDEVLWRLRALYGLKNAKGTKMLAIGGLIAYCPPGQENGPPHAKEVWGYEFESITIEQFAKRLEEARANPRIVAAVERQTRNLLAEPNVTLHTERKFVFNSFLALWVAKQIMHEVGATNFGFAVCMGRRFIEPLDTPACLVLALANDEGYTAYCHTDLTHTLPGVLLHWISGKPTFLCNSHFPHDGIFTVAHCAAPRKMDGKTAEPMKIMTHFESDYGAASKIEYAKGQVVTAVISNLHCTKWQGFRGRIVGSPSHPACRSQMDIQVDGDIQKILADQQGFHTQVCYGDYLREVGYALKKLKKIDWQNFST